MSLQDYQRQIDEWAQGLATPYWSPLSQFARLAEEVGEVGRALNHRYGDKPKKPTDVEQDLADELGDVLFDVICLANSEGIDLDAAMRAAIAKVHGRDKHRFAAKEEES